MKNHELSSNQRVESTSINEKRFGHIYNHGLYNKHMNSTLVTISNA